MTTWTSQHERILEDGHKAGKSARDIAEELTAAGYPCSRNSVLGRIHRKGWSDPSHTRGKRKPRVKVTWESTGCRWPFGDPGTTSFRFCCAEVQSIGKPYCQEHMARAYRKEEKEAALRSPRLTAPLGRVAFAPCTRSPRRSRPSGTLPATLTSASGWSISTGTQAIGGRGEQSR